MGSNQPVLLRPGSGNEKAEAPEDYQPGPGLTDTASAGGGKPGSELHIPPGQDNTDPPESSEPGDGEGKEDPQRRMVRKTIQAHRQQAKVNSYLSFPSKGRLQSTARYEK